MENNICSIQQLKPKKFYKIYYEDKGSRLYIFSSLMDTIIENGKINGLLDHNQSFLVVSPPEDYRDTFYDKYCRVQIITNNTMGYIIDSPSGFEENNYFEAYED